MGVTVHTIFFKDNIMASVNKVIIVGNLGQDPEVRYTPNNMAIATLSIATTYKAKEREPETEWHRVVIFGRLAEVAGEYLKKGSSVYIEGRLRTQKWTDKTGADRYTTEIVAEQMQMLGAQSGGSAPTKTAQAQQAPEMADADIPF